ncbi:MAG: circadian clock protein KaiA [Microcystaceae cyanobacterium]
MSVIPLSSRLSICFFIPVPSIAQPLKDYLSDQRYAAYGTTSASEFREYVEKHTEEIDCLIILPNTDIFPLFNQLYEKGRLLPIIIIDSSEVELSPVEFSSEDPTYFYHSSEVHLSDTELDTIPVMIDQAIAQFLHLAPSCPLSAAPKDTSPQETSEDHQSSLILQQRRLAEKLKERLGYLGVYYKRNPQHFYRNLPPDQKGELIKEIEESYRDIILTYFTPESNATQLIDQLVNQAFFSDVSVSQILEIHMTLMDEFAQQLKLEGRSEEILLDYRLTLIDILAHLGEMYRRSIPREDIPLDILYQID